MKKVYKMGCKRYAYCVKSFKSFPLSMTQVSSAYNKVDNNLETLHMSLIYIINKKGPRIEPWGTPHLT